MAATMVDMYVPLFGQRLAHLVPVAAGFLGAALAVGWTVSEIVSASLSRDRGSTVRIVAVAPLVMAVGLALAAVSQFDDASPRAGRRCGRWRCSITGVGVGMAWPHLSAWAMGCVDDPAEGAAAAAAINTVQLIAARSAPGWPVSSSTPRTAARSSPRGRCSRSSPLVGVLGASYRYRATRSMRSHRLIRSRTTGLD